MLMIDNYKFVEDYSTRDTFFMFGKEEGTEGHIWSIDCLFKDGKFGHEIVTPSICINPIETTIDAVNELVGETFEIKDVEEAEEREDIFGVYEEEPIVKYRVEILEIEHDKIRIKCNGTICIEEELHSFEMDSWLPIIQEVSDWCKFNL